AGTPAAPDRRGLLPRDLSLRRDDPGRDAAGWLPPGGRSIVRDSHLLPPDGGDVLRAAPATHRGGLPSLPGRPGADAPALPGWPRPGDRRRPRHPGPPSAAGRRTAGSLARIPAGARSRARPPGRDHGARVRLCRLRAGPARRPVRPVPGSRRGDPFADAMRVGRAEPRGTRRQAYRTPELSRWVSA